MTAPPPARCAIYTRKSADEATDSHLGSTTVQRELCEAYIRSQAGEGWVAMPQAYDDIGWSGGKLARPALSALRADIAAGKVDVVVVYKIDRLSRSLRDFLALVDEMTLRSVTFVSITQSFSTTTSMGRLTLNVLLSFAQFERELTGERLRDYFAEARARGIWNSPRPYGYQRGADGRLEIVEAEADVIRLAYRLYCKLGSARLVADELNLLGHRNKLGHPWAKHATVTMLTNPLYLGHMVHKGEALPGPHTPVVSSAIWHKAQAVMETSRKRRAGMARDPDEGLLRGRLQHHLGRALIHVTARGRTGLAYRYYVPCIERYGPETKPRHRFRAPDLEQAVLAALARVVGADLPALSHANQLRAMRKWVEMVTIHDDHMVIQLYAGGEIRAEHAGGVRIRYEWPKGQPPPWLADAQRLIADGMSISKAARQLGLPTGSVHRVIRKYEEGGGQ